MRPNHHQFVAFAYVVREGSFSAAATRLGVTQSTVTQHVAKLEQTVGAQLLLRGRDGVEVTPTGMEFYDLADRMVALDSAISERLAGFASMREGRLRVIANAPQPALGIIGIFAAAFPNIHIEFGLHDWTTATGMIRNRLADLGLITDAPNSDEWVRHRLQLTRYVLYCRKDNPLARRKAVGLEDLLDQTVILPEQGSLTQKTMAAKLRASGLRLKRTVVMTTFPVMCEAVLQGIGVAVFLRNSSLIREDLVEVELKEFDEPFETWLVMTKDRARLRLIEAFTQTALAHAH
ncbi:MAG: hypothetical protein Kilf2KO_10860 [Rhodospirillales bacterium]